MEQKKISSQKKQMPLRTLDENDSFETIELWLNDNLSRENSLKPHSKPIPLIESKGIYFWFMHPEGYEKLRTYVPIDPIKPRFLKSIDQIEYDLVYVGTTGTGKDGKSNLKGRLNWHINDKHRDTSIFQKNSALSTLRTGLGALLAEDLVIPNTENILNEFMAKYLCVFWLNYPDDNEKINGDEGIIINRIKPLFNLKKNPNSYVGALENSTRIYQRRRNEVEFNTKQRLELKLLDFKNIPKIIGMGNSAEKRGNVSLKNCMEFYVRRSQNIAEVADTILELPVGPCTIQLINKNNYDVRTYINAKTRRVISKDRKVSDYFRAPDTKNGNIPKFQIVSHEMNDYYNPIEIITVLVCK